MSERFEVAAPDEMAGLDAPAVGEHHGLDSVFSELERCDGVLEKNIAAASVHLLAELFAKRPETAIARIEKLRVDRL